MTTPEPEEITFSNRPNLEADALIKLRAGIEAALGEIEGAIETSNQRKTLGEWDCGREVGLQYAANIVRKHTGVTK